MGRTPSQTALVPILVLVMAGCASGGSGTDATTEPDVRDAVDVDAWDAIAEPDADGLDTVDTIDPDATEVLSDTEPDAVDASVEDLPGEEPEEEVDAGTTVSFTPTDDTWINQEAPTANHGTDIMMMVRNQNGSGGALHEFDTLVKFDISSIPSTTSISSATLYLYYLRWGDADPGGRLLNVHRISDAWSETTVTWDTRPSRETLVSDDAAVPFAIGAWMQWDVTVDVDHFVDGTWTNHGWMVQDENIIGTIVVPFTVFATKEFGGSTPYLEVTY